eukprot:g5405.t1
MEIQRLGVIADVQYADVEDGSDFAGREIRRYRSALQIAHEADFTACDAVLQLGDLVDGKAASHTERAAELKINSDGDDEPLKLELHRPWRFDVVGNHELYCRSRTWWRTNVWGERGIGSRSPRSGSSSSSSPTLYYSITGVGEGKRWRLIVLDCYAVSVLNLSAADGEEQEQRAKELLRTRNPHIVKAIENPELKIDYFEGVPLEKQRFCPYNGACGAEQREWLSEELAAAKQKGEFVAVFSHIPVLPIKQTEEGWKTLPWDADELNEIFATYKQQVVAVYGGHRHRNKRMLGAHSKDKVLRLAVSLVVAISLRGADGMMRAGEEGGEIAEEGAMAGGGRDAGGLALSVAAQDVRKRRGVGQVRSGWASTRKQSCLAPDPHALCGLDQLLDQNHGHARPARSGCGRAWH